jgi:ribosomal subunit interface protein
MSPVNIEITARGDVSDLARAHAEEAIGALQRYVKGPILAARVVLTQERNPRIPEQSRAEAEIDLQGHLLRAHAGAQSLEAAIDEVSDRLQRQLRAFVDRRVTRKRTDVVADHLPRS